MSEFRVIETQEELDRIIADRLARAKEKTREEFADYETIKKEKVALEKEVGELKATLETTNTESQGYKSQIEELNGKITGYETENLRTRIALQNGIPYDLANRLVGSSEEEIQEDAKKMAEYLGQSTPIPPLKSTERNEGEDPYQNLLNNLKGE